MSTIPLRYKAEKRLQKGDAETYIALNRKSPSLGILKDHAFGGYRGRFSIKAKHTIMPRHKTAQE